MAFSWSRLVDEVSRLFPEGTPRRKLLQIVSIILVFEGITVLVLFSYFGAILGVASLILGILLLLLTSPTAPERKAPSKQEPPGVRMVDTIVKLCGGEYVVMATGAALVVLVLLFNRFYSSRPELGDLDTLSILFGGMLLIYPFVLSRFKTEAIFSLLFLAFVVILLVIPQVVLSVSGSNGDSGVGNAYVHYMLAAPFAALLNLIGIDASSSGNQVTLQFHDGTLQTLGISAYCAGLYSFSIFLSAFFAFVLVFERLPTSKLVLVLGFGLLVAYLGNLFRMVIIGVVGYYKGMHALLWAHENVGWMIFLSWSAVFWYLILNYMGKHSSIEDSHPEAN